MEIIKESHDADNGVDENRVDMDDNELNDTLDNSNQSEGTQESRDIPEVAESEDGHFKTSAQ